MFQLAAFLDHFDRSQLLLIASEMLRYRPHEALRGIFEQRAVGPAAVHLDTRSSATRYPIGGLVDVNIRLTRFRP